MDALSVSSNGSTWVKPLQSPGAACSWQSFSILERIDVGETQAVFGIALLVWIFQYPRTDRRG